MNLPKMIMFDFGQTLMSEPFDGVAGTRAVMQHAISNKYNYTAEQIQEYVIKLNKELGRFNTNPEDLIQVEIPNSMFQPYLYESLSIEINLTSAQKDKIFWDAAAPGTPTEGIREFLNFLKAKKIRTGVISNICYDPEVVKERVFEIVPDNDFEFILCSSQYIFRKPSKHIFELGLTKAELNPEDVWYIGDNYYCDVQGARGAGITPIWYKGAMKNAAPVQDDTVVAVNHWEELKKIIENLEREIN